MTLRKAKVTAPTLLVRAGYIVRQEVKKKKKTDLELRVVAAAAF